jgi:hypothetical protein
MRTHADGSPCLTGTKKVPPGFSACCAAFAGHVDTCAFDVRYEWWERPRYWVIVIAESAGGGGVKIQYCPHCGSKLTS